jgi:hypothetical protein
LTHVASPVEKGNIPEIVRNGSGPMPRKNLDDDAVEALFTFFQKWISPARDILPIVQNPNHGIQR